MQDNRQDRALYEQAVQRVLASRVLHSKEGARIMFEYLAQQSLAGNSGRLKEYIVGIEAFGKPPTYDPQVDPSVRVQASRLRQALADYYRGEGSSDEVRIDFPKGRYELAFQLASPTPVAVSAGNESLRIKWQRYATAAMAVGLALCLIAIVVLVSERRSQAAGVAGGRREEAFRIWADFFHNGRPTVISLGTPMFVHHRIRHTGVFFRHPQVNTWEEAERSEDVRQMKQSLNAEYSTPSFIYTGVGEASGAFLLAKMFSGHSREVHLKRSTVLSWEDIKSNNIVFLGAPKNTQHLRNLPFEQAFTINGGKILNLHPRAGESDVYRVNWPKGAVEVDEDYALITRYPGLGGQGELIVLGGSSTEASLAAVEYVTEPRYAGELAGKLAQKTHRLPLAYQVVIKAVCKAQVPMRISYVTHRVLSDTGKPSRL